MTSNSSKTKHRILVIDDNSAIHDDFRKILTRKPATNDALDQMENLLFGEETEEIHSSSFTVDYAFQGKDGLDMVCQAIKESRPYGLAFVDGRMPPGWDGIETISRLWEQSPDLQVVLCTAYADYSWKEIREILGENDNLLILKKPFDNVEVLQLAHALTKKWELNNKVKGKLNQLAFYDHLTSLPNRTLFMDRPNTALDSAQRYGHNGALLFIDLDNFKRINDTLGHSVGDDILKVMGTRLLNSLRLSDTVSRLQTHPAAPETAARLGGDEFTVILPIIEREGEAALVAKRIEKHLSKPITIDHHEFIVTCSIGIAMFPTDGDCVETLLKNADLAMYFAKGLDNGAYTYYRQSMNEEAMKRLTLENQLRLAMDRKEFQLHYQPQIDLVNNQPIGLEALLRWHNQELGVVSPADFIPIAEESGLIIPIGEWVLRTACSQAKKWLDKGIDLRSISVNVSVKQFTHPDFVDNVKAILQETELDSRHLEIEITESLLVQNPEGVASVLESLRDLGLAIAVDDFGTGYSSLSRLKILPIDCLKIDQTFIGGIDQHGGDQSIIGAIIAMAEGMGLRVVAEGVEQTAQIDFLVQKNCGEAQGFYFSPALSSEEIEEYLKKYNIKRIVTKVRQ